MTKSAKEIFAAAASSVLAIRAWHGRTDKYGQKDVVPSDGSGVVVGKGEVVTNCHVVENAERIEIWQVDSEGEGGFVLAEFSSAIADDLCLLRAEKLTAPPAVIRGEPELQVGESVYAIGAPHNLPLTISGGIVSQLRGACLIQTNAAISDGSSGGGLFDGEGRLVGITTFSREGQNLNFALRVELVKELQERSETEFALRQELHKCLASPSPDGLNRLIGRILEKEGNPESRLFALAVMTREQARIGDIENARKNAAVVLKLMDLVNERNKLRARFESAWCLAITGDFARALALAGGIEDDVLRACALAVISISQPDGEKAAATLARALDIAKQAKDIDPQSLAIIAWACAEAGNLNEAMAAVEEIDKRDDDYQLAWALSSIAGAMARRNMPFAAKSFFFFARTIADDMEDDPEMWEARLPILGQIAWDMAEAGEIPVLDDTISEIGKSLPKVGYPAKMSALRSIAKAFAKAGNVREAIRATSSVTVIDAELAVCLAYIALAIVRHHQAEAQAAAEQENR